MDLLILGKDGSLRSSRYRGTERSTPYYRDEFRDDHPVNQSFLWYCEEGGEAGAVHDLARAKKLVSLYSKLQPPQEFEIVEVLRDNLSPAVGQHFLGFDLSAGYNHSLLSWDLEIDLPTVVYTKLEELRPLLHLIKEHFKPRINGNGLFDDYDVAKFCLGCMMALQAIYPNLWENEEVVFEVVGLWKVA